MDSSLGHGHSAVRTAERLASIKWVTKAVRPLDTTEWFRQNKYSRRFKDPTPKLMPPRYNLGGLGPRSLVDMAITVVGDSFNLLEADSLDHVPAHLILRLFEYIDGFAKVWPPHDLSLQAFKIISKRLVKEHRQSFKERAMPRTLYQWGQTILTPTEPLIVYTNPLISTSFEFIAHLTIAGRAVSFGTHELLGLTQLKNLGVLEIFQPSPAKDSPNFPRVNDAIIRHWSQETNPFPVLRIMRIWGDNFTTADSLRYLRHFPSLAVYDVAGRENDWKKAVKLPGWDVTIDMDYGLFSSSWNCCASFTEGQTPLEFVDKTLQDTTVTLMHYMIDPKFLNDVSVAERDSVLRAVHEPADGRFRTSDHCKGTDAFSWGNSVYGFIGRLWSDKDLAAQGVGDTDQVLTVYTDLVLPARPYVGLALGECCEEDSSRAKVKGRRPPLGMPCCVHSNRGFEAYYTFIRTEYRAPDKEKESKPDSGLKRSRQPTGPSKKLHTFGDFVGLNGGRAT
ncbi:hypothetical protein F4677DRAFT_436831 [Hypoxylon crocopeplum]|nr:hypothetical protein F4677DRAFT_436831 [Hypoxylon crocopeplum]